VGPPSGEFALDRFAKLKRRHLFIALRGEAAFEQ
jgi:hypothetical protein